MQNFVPYCHGNGWCNELMDDLYSMLPTSLRAFHNNLSCYRSGIILVMLLLYNSHSCKRLKSGHETPPTRRHHMVQFAWDAFRATSCPLFSSKYGHSRDRSGRSNACTPPVCRFYKWRHNFLYALGPCWVERDLLSGVLRAV